MVTKEINIVVNKGQAESELNKLEKSFKDVDKEASKTSKSVDDVVSNGGAIAILDQLTGGLASRLRDAYEATKLFNFSLKATKTALISTGIGALVVALGFIVAYWDDIVDFIGGANKKIREQNELLGINVGVLDERLKFLRQEKKFNEENNISNEKLIEKEKQLLSSKAQNLKLELKNLEIQYEKENSLARQQTFWESLTNSAPKLTNEEAEALAEREKKILDLRASLNETQRAYDELNSVTIIVPKKEDLKKIKSKEDEEDPLVLAEKTRQEKINQIREEFNRKNEDAEDEFQIDKLERQYTRDLTELEALKATQEQKYELEKYYNALIEEERNRIINEFEDQQEQDSIDREDARLKMLYDNAQKEIAIEEDVAEAKARILDATVNNVSNGFALLGQLAGKNRAVMATALIGENAAGIAKQIINTKAANALAKASPLNLATAGAYGASQSIANNISLGLGIASSTLATAKALSSLGGGGAVGSVGSQGGGGAQAPSFNLVQGTQQNQLAESIAGLNDKPVQAIVVASSVTTAQQANRNKIDYSSI